MVGNLSNFTKIDILRCLLKIEKPVSRSQLSKFLDLGEGTIRAILDILKKNKLLESNKQGHYLSAKGDVIAKKIKSTINIKKIDLNNIPPDKKKIAVHIKNPNKTLKSYVLRDEAVKNGADGALILKYDKKLVLYDMDYEQDFSELENKFDLGKNNVVIITYADSYKLAENGALAAAIYLNSNLENIMQKFK
jgi:predicted transcriptional regulator